MAGGKAIIKISCGNETGFLYPERFGPAGRSLCIKLDKKKDTSGWMSPVEFEKLSGKGAQHNWKRTVRAVSHDNKMLWTLIEEGTLKICADKHCKCSPCSIALAHRQGQRSSQIPKVPKDPEVLKVEPKEEPKDEKQKALNDTDSDSGISVEISNDSPSTPVIREPITTKEQEAPLPNYTAMVQEAIVALTAGGDGCSLLGIFLYVLNQYPMMEPVSVMNTKIRSTILMLKRVGIVENVGGEEIDELESVANEIKKEPNSPKKDEKEGQTVKELTTEPKKKKVNKPKDLKKPSNTKSTAPTAKSNKKVLLMKKKLLLKKKFKSSGKENSTSSNRAPFSFHTQKPKKLSPALTAICGKKQMGRNEAVKGIWAYIKKNNLQDPNQKTVILCDEKLKAVTKKKKVLCVEVLGYLHKHMTSIN